MVNWDDGDLYPYTAVLPHQMLSTQQTSAPVQQQPQAVLNRPPLPSEPSLFPRLTQEEINRIWIDTLRTYGSNEERGMPSTYSPQRVQPYHSHLTPQNAPASILVATPPRSPPTVIHHRSSSSTSKPSASTPPNTHTNRLSYRDVFRQKPPHDVSHLEPWLQPNGTIRGPSTSESGNPHMMPNYNGEFADTIRAPQSYHSHATIQNAPTSISVVSPQRSPPTVIHHRSSSPSSKPSASMPPNTPANRSPNMNEFRSSASHVASYQQQQSKDQTSSQPQRQHYIRHQSRGSADSAGSGGRKTNGYPQVPTYNESIKCTCRTPQNLPIGSEDMIDLRKIELQQKEIDKLKDALEDIKKLSSPSSKIITVNHYY